MSVLKICIAKTIEIINRKNFFFFVIISCLFCFCYLFKILTKSKNSILTNTTTNISNNTKKKVFRPFFSLPIHNEHQLIEKIALKEQIEEDLKIFDFIDNVKVGFYTNQDTQVFSKLSLIISPNVKFNEQTYIKLKSIIDYLCSTVNNLSPDKISISDKEGNFYNVDEIFSLCSYDIQNILYKKELSLEIETYIQKILPKKHYFFLLNISGEEQKQAYIDFNINNEYFNLLSQSQQNQLFSDISTLIKGLCLNKNISTNITFHKSQFLINHLKLSFKQKITIATVYLLASCILMLSSYIYLLSQNLRKSNKQTYLNQLTNFIKTEKPNKIAEMLKYLDKEKANFILESLNEKTKKEIKNFIKEDK